MAEHRKTEPIPCLSWAARWGGRFQPPLSPIPQPVWRLPARLVYSPYPGGM